MIRNSLDNRMITNWAKEHTETEVGILALPVNAKDENLNHSLDSLLNLIEA